MFVAHPLLIILCSSICDRLQLHGFHDAVKMGDGEQIVHYWKFMLVILSSNHPNYAKEAVNVYFNTVNQK